MMKKIVRKRRKKVKSLRVNAHTYKKLERNWRKPKGKDARDKINRKANVPRIGRSMKKEYRYLHPSGLKEIIVRNLKDLEKVKDGFGIRIAHSVGKKKRTQIIEESKKRGIRIFNLGEKVEGKQKNNKKIS